MNEKTQIEKEAPLKRLEREEYERMIDDDYHVDLIDEVLETFCDHPKKGKEHRLEDVGYKKNYLNLYRESMKRDFISDTYRITLYEEQLAELEELKINMIDAEEEEYSDDSLGQSIVGFVFICLINWFIFGPLLLAFGEADMNYEFLSPLANLGDLHWSLSLLYIFVNYGLCFFSGIMLLSTYSFLFAPSYGLFRRKLTAEQQKDKAIEAITLKIENLCREVKRKKYIKRFLDA